MQNIKFIKTEDGSTGLYNLAEEDIYHSKSGAKKEAFDKFVNPIIRVNKDLVNKSFSLLDICYGIGYNTKALLTYVDDAEFYIDCLDYDKNVIYLSPFINDCISNKKIDTYIIYNLIKNPEAYLQIQELLFNNLQSASNEFINADLYALFCDFINEVPTIYPPDSYHSNLHNIYYSYISDKMKDSFKFNYNKKSQINFYFDDARQSIKSLNKQYDIVFLDGFSPQKNPSLWTYDFLLQIKNKIHDNTIITSYSKSTPFRNALLKLGFNVGKTFIDEIDMGTIASFNKNYIINPLDDYDLELMTTTSGIVYRDESLNLTAQEIVYNRNLEQKNSNLISHTQLLKSFKQL
ncbi:hypothetical protein II906_08790 [bacterium]|nr:hypothetical protein [bacterium]